MKLAKLTEKGLHAFSDYLNLFRQGEDPELPRAALTDPELSVILADVDIDPEIVFLDRFHCAAYLNSALADLESGLEQDVGLWAWLTLLYFDQLCPPAKDGTRKVYEQARYIPVPTNFQKYYRHLLSGPYFIYRAHSDMPERARVALTGQVHVPGEMAEQLLAGQERMTNRAVLDAASYLYLEVKRRALKRGAGGKGPGSARRFVDVLNQLDLNYDLYALTGGELILLLPQEFERFKSGVSPDRKTDRERVDESTTVE